MSLDKAMKNLKFDARMLEFNLANGLLTKEEYERYMSQLPDSTAQAEKIDLEESASKSDFN